MQQTCAPSISLLASLKARGLLHQATDEPSLGEHLRSVRTGKGQHTEPGPLPGHGRVVYCGFDPTADSLTIGNLVPILLLRHFQLAGHTPVVIAGGGTGLIGDPSGKSAERQLRSRDEIDANVRAQSRIFERILDFSPALPNRAYLLNNADWLGQLSFLDALRDVGKHFSVNAMIQRDSVRDRLNNREQGISFTEFSYMILQSYDFLVLNRDYQSLGLPGPVTIQCGGSDQWGNMVGGIDLIRRVRAAESSDGSNLEPERQHAFCLTAPLVTKADGGKFGKSESGAIWLSGKADHADTSVNRTSPFAFYQFWLNTADADVGRYLRIFTFLPIDKIESLEAAHAAEPAKRAAQKQLAEAVTRIVHGEEELAKAMHATASLFGAKGGSSAGAVGTASHDAPFVLPEDIVAAAPSSQHDRALLEGTGLALVDVLASTTLAKSKTEARTLLAQNSISVNGHKAAADARLTLATLLPGDSGGQSGLIALRRGGKTWHITRWSST